MPVPSKSLMNYVYENYVATSMPNLAQDEDDFFQKFWYSLRFISRYVLYVKINLTIHSICIKNTIVHATLEPEKKDERKEKAKQKLKEKLAKRAQSSGSTTSLPEAVR